MSRIKSAGLHGDVANVHRAPPRRKATRVFEAVVQMPSAVTEDIGDLRVGELDITVEGDYVRRRRGI